MKQHLTRYWHYHTALWFTLAAGIIAFSATSAAVHYTHRGGLKLSKLPPPISISGGRVPTAHSLGNFIVRVHDQGLASSCVGQTLATIEEITYREALGLHRFGGHPEARRLRVSARRSPWGTSPLDMRPSSVRKPSD